jgi:hypothetical protein
MRVVCGVQEVGASNRSRGGVCVRCARTKMLHVRREVVLPADKSDHDTMIAAVYAEQSMVSFLVSGMGV